MKVLITGAGGYIGSYLAAHLPSNYSIVATTREDLDMLNRDAVKSFLEQGQFDAVLNCAIQGKNLPRSQNPSLMYANLRLFFNLADYRHLYGQLINFGSGSEFDIDLDLDCVNEENIFNVYPRTTYGASKNIISRFCFPIPNFTTLRIFGCFDPSEKAHKKITPIQHFIKSLKHYDPDPWAIENDRFFDWFSLHDIMVVVDAVLKGNVTYKDMNLVYAQKCRISDFLRLYCTAHGHDPELVRVNSTIDIRHTGDGSKLASCNLPIWGLERSLKEYGF